MKLLLTLLILFPFKIFAFENDLVLKAGLGLSQASVHAFDESEDSFAGFGFNNQFGYRFIDWEINLASYIYWGKVNDLRFKANGDLVQGTGGFRHVSFGPVLKYTFKWRPVDGWNFYLGAGPSWSIQTIKLANFQVGPGVFSEKYKLTYISSGAMLAVGIEEILLFKEMHPVYLEIVYSYKVSQELTISDATDFTEVKTISEEESEQKIRSSFIMINAGIVLF